MVHSLILGVWFDAGVLGVLSREFTQFGCLVGIGPVAEQWLTFSITSGRPVTDPSVRQLYRSFVSFITAGQEFTHWAVGKQLWSDDVESKGIYRAACRYGFSWNARD